MDNRSARPDRVRRRLLAALAGAGLGAALPNARAASATSAWQSTFAPFDGPLGGSLGGGFDGSLECPALPVEGRLPDGLSGTLYRNGPARMRLGATRYHHWFDGDGMVQRFSLEAGRIAHRGVLLRTPKLIEEEAAGRFLYPSFGTAIAPALPVLRPDTINVANINVMTLAEGRELYALWEGGSALELDPKTLGAKGFKKWSPETAGAPFCAHPRIEPDGGVWAFGYVPGSGHLLVYQLSALGALRRQAFIELPQADMVHDFAVTEHYLVFLLMPLVYESQATYAGSFASHFRWDAKAPLVVAVLDKSDLSVRRFELPADGLFHIGNAWEERGVIRLGYVSQPEILTVIQGRGLDAPYAADPGATTRWKEIEVDLAAGRVRSVATGIERVEFPRFDTRLTGRTSPLTVLLERSPAMPAAIDGHDSVLAVRAGGCQRFRYGANWIAEEHLFVPDRSSTHPEAGFLLGTAYDWQAERTALSIFDARHVDGGPVARVLLPYGLPLGLHGQFVAKT